MQVELLVNLPVQKRDCRRFAISFTDGLKTSFSYFLNTVLKNAEKKVSIFMLSGER